MFLSPSYLLRVRAYRAKRRGVTYNLNCDSLPHDAMQELQHGEEEKEEVEERALKRDGVKNIQRHGVIEGLG